MHEIASDLVTLVHQFYMIPFNPNSIFQLGYNAFCMHSTCNFLSLSLIENTEKILKNCFWPMAMSSLSIQS